MYFRSNIVRIAFSGLLCIVFIAISCKKSTDSNPVNNNNTGGTGIGPSGGTVTSSDGKVQVVIPAGALSSTQSVAIVADTVMCPQGVGTSYSLTPNGLTFNTPATLTIHYNNGDTIFAHSNPNFLGVAYQDDNGKWWGVSGGTNDTNGQTVTVPISHFSNWSLYDAVFFTMSSSMVLTGSTSMGEVTIVGLPVTQQAGQPVQLTPSPQNPGVKSSLFYVNGALNGNSTVGTVTGSAPNGSASDCSYLAPSTMPSPNSVSVQLKVTWNDGSTQSAFQNVSILAQKWSLGYTFLEKYFCNGSDLPYYYTAAGHTSTTLTLGNNAQVVSSSNDNSPGTLSLTDYGICPVFASAYAGSFSSGNGMEFNKVTGGYNGNSMLLYIAWTDHDQIGDTITANGIFLASLSKPVQPAEETSGQGGIYFQMRNLQGGAAGGGTITIDEGDSTTVSNDQWTWTLMALSN